MSNDYSVITLKIFKPPNEIVIIKKKEDNIITFQINEGSNLL